jgi:hypothetical protein
MSNEQLVLSGAFFAAGAVFMVIAWAFTVILGNLRREGHQKHVNAARESISDLVTTISNALASYSQGTMGIKAINTSVPAKLEQMAGELQQNMHLFDPYFVKYIEKYIEDSRATLRIANGSYPGESTAAGSRSSRPFFDMSDVDALGQTQIAPRIPALGKAHAAEKKPVEQATDKVPTVDTQTEHPPAAPTARPTPPSLPPSKLSAKSAIQKIEKSLPAQTPAEEYAVERTQIISGEEIRAIRETMAAQLRPAQHQPQAAAAAGPGNQLEEEIFFTQAAKSNLSSFETADTENPAAQTSDFLVEEPVHFEEQFPEFNPPEPAGSQSMGSLVEFNAQVTLPPEEEEIVELSQLADRLNRVAPAATKEDESHDLITGDDVIKKMDDLFRN